MHGFTKSKLTCSMFLVSMLTACGGSDDANLAPVINTANLAITLDEDTIHSGAITATDDNNAVLSFTVGSAASNGVFALNSDGTYTYTPTADFTGTDTVVINVSDGDKAASATVTFTVTNINDAPVLMSTNIAVSSQGVTTGTLNVTDVDGDALTFAIEVDTEHGALTLDAVTGDFEYVAQDLGQLDSEFSISYTDGNIETPIIEVIEIAPSYVSNQDKSGYYYSSEQSHLSIAESVSAQLSGDVARDELSSALASGYFIASFPEKANELLDSINEVVAKAKAYRTSANTLQDKGDAAGALELRQYAEVAYDAYITQKGSDNISRDDAILMYSLHSDYIDGGSTEAAAAYALKIADYAAQVYSEESSNTYNYFVTAVQANANERLSAYLSDRTTANYDNALAAITTYAELAVDIGYKTSNDQQYYNLPIYHSALAANAAYRLGAIELAKEYTAKALSFYQATNYDEDYSYDASPYAEYTLVKYAIGLKFIAGTFEGLYPELDSVPLAILGEDHKYYDDAIELQLAYKALNDVLAGDSIETAIAPIKEYFVEQDDYRSYYYAVVEFSSTEPRLGALLAEQGEHALALNVYNYASTLLTSADYIDSQSSNSYTSGYKGCTRLTQLTIASGSDGVAQAATCQTMIDTYFGIDTDHFSDNNSLTAKYELMLAHWITGNNDAIAALGETLASDIATLEAQSTDLDSQFDQAERYLKLAGALATYTQFDSAQVAYKMAMTKLQEITDNETADGDMLEDVIELLEEDVANYAPADTGTFERKSYLVALRHGAGQYDNYASQLGETLTILQALTNTLNSKIATLSTNEQQDLMEVQLMLNLHAGLTLEADTLINSDIVEDADKQELLLLKGEFLTAQDAFPASRIASVDTDADGKPDFFILEATAEQISASGLTLDDDNDNDGTANAEDITPIG